jgi:hypothetical protein
MERKLYQHIAVRLEAMQSCSDEWKDKHTDSIESLVLGYMPSGSGIDAGTKLSFEDSTPNKLVFVFSYHHMDSNGYYDGWTDYKLIVTPSLSFGMDMRITGRDRNDVKEYLYQTFEYALNMIIEA